MTPNDPSQTTQGTQPTTPIAENTGTKDNFDIEINLDTSISSPTATNDKTVSEDEISLDLSDISSPSPAVDTPLTPATPVAEEKTPEIKPTEELTIDLSTPEVKTETQNTVSETTETKPTETESLTLDLPSEPVKVEEVITEPTPVAEEPKPTATTEDRLKTEDKIVEVTQPVVIEEKKPEVVEIKTETAPVIEENPIIPEAKPVEEKAPTADFSIEKDKAIIGEIQNMTSSTPNVTQETGTQVAPTPAPTTGINLDSLIGTTTTPTQTQEVAPVQPVASTGMNLDMFTTPIYAQQQITTQSMPSISPMPVAQPVSQEIKIPKVNNILMYGIIGIAVLVI
jgi:hypothetical protein